MPAYTYLIKDESGGRSEGQIKADNLDTAMQKLSSENQIIVKLEEIDTTWDFIGPFIDEINLSIERFKNMLKTESYSMLLNHTTHEVLEVYKSSKLATFEVTVLDKEKKYYKFKWQVEKYDREGQLKNCWLTTAVSQPIPLGSSI